MQGRDQQAYDRGTTIFSPDGRLYQVEYAREAVKQGAPVVGVRGADATVLAAQVSARSTLVERSSVEKLSSVDGRAGIASAGHAADARQLVDLVRRRAQAERLRFDEAASVETLALAVGDHIQESTQVGGTRPYGTALLIGGYDETPHLFETDPSGATHEWRATAAGRGATDIIPFFEEQYTDDLEVDDALNLAVAGLLEPNGDLDPGSVRAVTIGPQGYQSVDESRLGDALNAAS